MGGRPRWALIALACPAGVGLEDAEEFYSGLLALASEHGVAVVGGDTAASPAGWLVNVTLLGEAVAAPLLRSTARAGDVVAVTGALGRSAAGLALLESPAVPAGLAPAAGDDVRAAHLRPRPRVRDGVLVKLLGLVLFVLCSALLTGAEAAYFSLGRARLKRVADAGAGAVKPLIERPHDLLVTLLVGITVINIAAAALAALIADALFGHQWALPVQMLGTILILTTFGEVLPMTLAVKYPERFLTLAHRPVGWLGRLLTPVRALLGALSELTVRLIGSERQGQPELSDEEVRTVLNVGEIVGGAEGAGLGMVNEG